MDIPRRFESRWTELPGGSRRSVPGTERRELLDNAFYPDTNGRNN